MFLESLNIKVVFKIITYGKNLEACAPPNFYENIVHTEYILTSIYFLPHFLRTQILKFGPSVDQQILCA